MKTPFQEAYGKLNTEQKKAVDTIDGPVMVIAGPGTGKTQVLSLRIANILNSDAGVQADAVLCLTFTNSGVRAMQERLRTYIGSTASRVAVLTFHSFGMKILEEFYRYLDLETPPTLIDDMQSVSLCDEILHAHDWKYIRTRANPALYFHDIKSLISLLKRERISPEVFSKTLESEIKSITTDPDNISSRGATRGSLKQEALKKIEGLERTKEMVAFYEYYEAVKKEKNYFDYDDVLETVVRLVEISDEVRDTIRIRYQYILVDEHQDSSGVQNKFLEIVWGGLDEELGMTPNIFVVGDDRQLIYGFGGASIEYFQNFEKAFSNVKHITLSENYRSTQAILDSADTLLQSSLAKAKLKSNIEGSHPIQLVACDYPRDEIISAGLEIKEKINQGIDPNHVAILVPKNYQVKSAMRILADLGIPVASGSALKLFELDETQSFRNILALVASPFSPNLVAQSLLNPLSQVPPLEAHSFLVEHDTRKLTLAKLLEAKDSNVLAWAEKIQRWVEQSVTLDVYSLVQVIGQEVFLDTAKNHEELTRRVEILRSFLHLSLSQDLKLPEFLDFINRLEAYGTDIPLAVFGADQGVKVMTLHGSKGLEFEYVWIAHMDEKNLAGKRAGGFTLPESIKDRIEEKDELVIKRQLYVAITRAKRFCTLSYARHGYTGGDQQLAHVISDMPQELFGIKTGSEENVLAYVAAHTEEKTNTTLTELAEMVADEYVTRNISVSALNNFFECPWKWYFRNLVQLPQAESISLQFGNVVHGTIERILKQKLHPKKKDIQILVADAVEKIRGLEDSELERVTKDATEIVERWVKKRLPTLLPEYESEKPFYNFHDPEFEHLKITGKIDLLEKQNEIQVQVTDFKTGSVKKSVDIEREGEEGRMSDYLRQLTMYSFLLAGTSHDQLEVVSSRLEFVEAEDGDKHAVYATHITDEHIDRLRQDIRDYDKLLKSGKWVERPCYFKSYGKSQAECEYCKMANEVYLK